jgi:hypothetical protein
MPCGRWVILVVFADVDGVIAYKRNLVYLDLIGAAFGTAAGATELNEGMPGWDQLMEALPVRLPGARSYAEAFREIATPPFAANKTTLFKRVG